MSAWIDRSAALSTLRVKAQTLYAYVSRGRIRAQPDPTDSRRSLYNAADIASITSQKVRGRSPSRIAASSMDWGEPAIGTAVSSIENGQLRYRGKDAIAFASAATLEETAQLLWCCADRPMPKRCHRASPRVCGGKTIMHYPNCVMLQHHVRTPRANASPS